MFTRECTSTQVTLRPPGLTAGGLMLGVQMEGIFIRSPHVTLHCPLSVWAECTKANAPRHSVQSITHLNMNVCQWSSNKESMRAPLCLPALSPDACVRVDVSATDSQTKYIHICELKFRWIWIIIHNSTFITSNLYVQIAGEKKTYKKQNKQKTTST